jgi:ribA/ribD-fused uncharacterized protein
MLLGQPHPTLFADDLPEMALFTSYHPFLKGVFSQWHATRFTLHDRTFVTAEQWMMFAKAMLFGDETRASAIMATDDPAEQKRLGQRVADFDQTLWDHWKVDIVFQGNLAKFQQNGGAARQLAGTGSALLVEANPRDWIWGAGLAADDPAFGDPAQWRGTNLLGRILTKVRDEI